MGAKLLAPIKGVNRNVKLNLVSEAFFRKEDESFNVNDPNWHIKLENTSGSQLKTIKSIMDVLEISETREVYGLTFRDLIDMDSETFNYISEKVVNLAKARIERQKQAERNSNESKR